MPRTTHYDVLGLGPNADVAEIRDAYRRLAREHHPDRALSSNRAGVDAEMATINEAYRVLSDPARRVVYDAGLRGADTSGQAVPPRATGSESSPTTATFPSHLGPARFPWRSVMFVATLAIIGVVVLAQFTEPGEPRGPDGLIQIGSCVTIDPNGDAREAQCVDDPAVDLVVEAFVPFSDSCPGGTVAHRDRQGMGIACVADAFSPAG